MLTFFSSRLVDFSTQVLIALLWRFGESNRPCRPFLTQLTAHTARFLLLARPEMTPLLIPHIPTHNLADLKASLNAVYISPQMLYPSPTVAKNSTYQHTTRSDSAQSS